MMTLIVGDLCLVGIALCCVAWFREHRQETGGQIRDPRAVMQAFNEWRDAGVVSPATKQWLETGEKTR